MSSSGENDYTIPSVSGHFLPHPVPATRRRAPAPPPPPRRSSIPAALEGEIAHFVYDSLPRTSPLPEADSTSPSPHASDTEGESSDEDHAYDICDSTPSGKVVMAARRVPSYSPTPKPRSSKASISRSRSCDHLAGNSELESSSGQNTFPLASNSAASGRPVMVAPPRTPGSNSGSGVVVTSSPDASLMTFEPTSSSATPSSTYLTLGSLSSPSLSRALPLRIEMMEGYMSNHIPQITFSASDMFNVHLIKQQEVVRVKDCNGHVYSIPLHSSVQIGIIQDYSTGDKTGGKGAATLPKLGKVHDIMQMKELPKMMCARKAVKSNHGDASSIEENEILLIKEVAKVPTSKKKKVLKVYSITKDRYKILYPDCAGHFSLNPLLNSLPLSTFFKHVGSIFPFKAKLFFKSDYTISMHCSDPETSIPPASLTENQVMVLKKNVETSIIASPHFEDSPVDVSASENLLHIPLDRYLCKVEINLVDVSSLSERNKLYNDTCTVHEKINLSYVKYYHDSDSELVHHTQTYLYTKCKAPGRTGIKMDLPCWKASSDNTQLSQQSACEQEAYQTIPDVFGSTDDIAPPTPARRKVSSPTHTLTSSMSASNFSNSSSQSELSRSNQFGGGGDDVFIEDSSNLDSRPPMALPPSSLHHTSSASTLPSPTKEKRRLRPVYSVGDTQSRPSVPSYDRPPAHLPTTHERPPVQLPSSHERPPIHLPSSHERPPVHLPSSHERPPVHLPSSHERPPAPIPPAPEVDRHYQTPRQALLSSIATFDRESLTPGKPPLDPPMTSTPSRTPSRRAPAVQKGDLPPRDLKRNSPNKAKEMYQSPASTLDREGFKRSLDSSLGPAGLHREAESSHFMSSLRDVNAPLPPPPNSGLYQTPRYAADQINTKRVNPVSRSPSTLSDRSDRPGFYDHPGKFDPSSLYDHPSASDRLRGNDYPNLSDRLGKYDRPPITPIKSKLASKPAYDEDDGDLYEEMSSIPARTGRAPRVVGVVRGGTSVPQPVGGTSTLDKTNPGGSSSSQRGRDSVGYEIFDPPVSSKDLKEFKAEITTLNKNFQTLSDQLEKLENEEVKALKEALAHALERIEVLESGCSHGNSAGGKGVSTLRSNRDYLKTLSCEQLQLVLEGMGLRQYAPIFQKEGLDGQILVDLDEKTLTNELGVASHIHRLKLMKLIGGEYRASNYYKEQATPV